MNELRKDPTRGQWVLIRPEPPAGDGSECPYCPGAEAASGPEIAAYRKDGSAPNTPGWMVRESMEYPWARARESNLPSAEISSAIRPSGSFTGRSGCA